MQIGFDVGATKIESVVLEETGQENFREIYISTTHSYGLIEQTALSSRASHVLICGPSTT